MGQRLVASMEATAQFEFRPEEAERTRELFQFVLEFMEAINPKFTQLNQRQSELDKAVDKILHDIEVEGFDMYQAYVTLKRLQVLRQERRKVKAMTEAWRLLKHTFGRTDEEQKALLDGIRQIDSCLSYLGVTPAEVVNGETAAD
jgi:hypothetical protein